MRKKLYKNLTTLVLTFALAMGTLIGTTMDVMAANNFEVDVTASKDDIQQAGQGIIFEPGDSITHTGGASGSIINIWLKDASGNQRDYDSIRSKNNSLYFPDEISLGGKTYKKPKWKLTSVDVLPWVSGQNILLYFDVCSEPEPEPIPEEKPEPAPEEKPNTTTDFKASTLNSYVPSHECSFQWVTIVDPQPGVDGLEEYKCMSCGIVKESQPIPASMATVKNLYGFIKDAPENGAVTTDFGKLHTISDYLLKKMSERNDVTTTIQFEYNNTKLQITFPAGTDYTPVLTDADTMYGFYGVAAKLGLTVTER